MMHITALGVQAQDKSADTQPAKAAVSVRKADAASLKKLRNSKDYNYEVTKPDRLLTWWEKVKQWFWDLLLAFFSDSGPAPFIRIALIVIIALFIILKLLNTNISRLFYKNKNISDIAVNEIQEDINTLDFDKLIEQYTSQHDYRMAVRYYYLRLLKTLNNKGLISWRINKTNRDYILELTSSPLYGSFDKLSSFYEYVWYGDFVLAPDQFVFIRDQFTNVTNTLSNEEKD